MKNAESTKNKTSAWLVVGGILGAALGVACVAAAFLMPKEGPKEISFPTIPSKVAEKQIYSNLTGLPVASEAEVTAPTYCVQTPNGTDGARPQAGLNQAGVVFEAIAEAGITRFAAIYQNPTSAVIGPIRSLRLYYLQWDTPFDCTIVHAGGADDALAAVRNGGYKDLSENYEYMYRGNAGSRLWNNLFTTGAYLKQMNADWGYGGSQVNGFARMTPEESQKSRIDNTVSEKLDIVEPASGNTSTRAAKVTGVGVYFGGWPNFNVIYSYNADENVYYRGYESEAAADMYVCPNEDLGEVNPESACELKVMSPAVVAVMMVEEHKAEDNYHEDIQAVGSGEAYVFQNGLAYHGTWSKASVESQIKFLDDSGVEIRLAPGQTFVEAVPNYGSVAYW
ncbi:DUF3048 domain-containing protein [Candidatus Saccharibacteria bacterium]|nr:DUF3048 domain-containing protein [Candidatus Saccharibacteria bacterium]